MDDYRLFYLFNDRNDVRAYHAEIPNMEDDHVTMQLRGPFDLTSSSYGELVSEVAAEPVFDSQAVQVIYATNAKHDDKKGKVTGVAVDGNPKDRSAIDVWTIGRYVSRDKVERTTLRGITWKARPSVVLEGGFISASVPEYYPRDNRYSEIKIVQKQESGLWATADFNDDSGGLEGGMSKLFAGTRPKMEYLYHMTPQKPSEAGWFDLNTIRSANFKQLSKDKNLNWQTSNFYPSFELPQLPAHAFSDDVTNKTPRLLLFSFRKDDSAILAASIKLRADGSLDGRSGNEVDVQGPNIIDIDQSEPGKDDDERDDYPGPRRSKGSTNLNAFVFDNQLLLTWTTDEGPGGIIGKLDEDGTVPEDWEWSTVTMKLNKPYHASASNYSFNGVLVSRDFI